MDKLCGQSALGDHLKRCPQCKEPFTYHRYDTSDSSFPLLLECGHNMCFVCVFERLPRLDQISSSGSEASNSPQRNSCLIKCAICQQPQSSVPLRRSVMAGFSVEDVVNVFPLDLYTIGWLAAQDNLPRDMLPMLDELKPVECTFESSLARSACDTNGTDQQKCTRCAGSHCLTFCQTCDSKLCLICYKNHDQECASPAIRYLRHDGRRFEVDPSCSLHNRPLHFVEKKSGVFGCVGCVTAESDKKFIRIQSRNAQLIGEKTTVTTKLCKDIVEQTKSSIELIEKSLLLLPEKCAEDSLVYMKFLNKLVSNLAKKRDMFLKKAAATDGQRLALLHQLKEALGAQLGRLDLIAAKLEFFIREGEIVATGLEAEIDAIVEELNDFGLFDSSWVEMGRIEWDNIEKVKLGENMAGDLRQYLDHIEEKLDFGSEVKAVLDAERLEKCTEVLQQADGTKVYRLLHETVEGSVQ